MKMILKQDQEEKLQASKGHMATIDEEHDEISVLWSAKPPTG